ncbi:MAG: DUF3795 domain-containing protein [Planctomycetota bacterium]
MDEIIGYCGLNCCTCPIYVATREKDDEKRRKMRAEIAEQIKKHYGVEYEPEDGKLIRERLDQIRNKL